MHMIASYFQVVTFDSIPATTPLHENKKIIINDFIVPVIYCKHHEFHKSFQKKGNILLVFTAGRTSRTELCFKKNFHLGD